MGANDHIFDGYTTDSHRVVCDCGAVYEISEGDGTPGCRDIECVYCDFCGKELAHHFGDCNGRLVDDSVVDVRLKEAKQCKDKAVVAYIRQHGYDWGGDEYGSILNEWHQIVSDCMKDNDTEVE